MYSKCGVPFDTGNLLLAPFLTDTIESRNMGFKEFPRPLKTENGGQETQNSCPDACFEIVLRV
jgi:hypothetical protein